MRINRKHPVPDDQRHLARRDRQHPYRAADDAEQAEIDREAGEILARVDRMFHRIALNCMTAQERQYRPEWRDEVVAHAQCHVWATSLARYDAWRTPRVSLTTFLFQCILNVTRDQLTKLRRRARRQHDSEKNLAVAAPDQRHDRQVERLSLAIMRAPERFGFSRPQGDVIRAITAAPPETPLQDIARGLGYAHPASLSAMLQRVKAKILALDIEGIDLSEFSFGEFAPGPADHLPEDSSGVVANAA